MTSIFIGIVFLLDYIMIFWKFKHFCVGYPGFKKEIIVKNIKIRYTIIKLYSKRTNGDAMYYAKDVTDPDYCALKFTAKSGRYYSNLKSEDFEV